MFSKRARDEFKKIVKTDYGKDLTDEQTEDLSVTFLRLTRVGLSVLARKYEKDKKKSN